MIQDKKYNKLIESIHEKIESLQNEYDDDVKRNNDDDFPSPHGAEIHKAIRELQSLLESENKK